VEALFEGEPDAVQALVDWCARGPRGAQVDAVDESREEPQGLSGFEIR
jgi:acylphosphatase